MAQNLYMANYVWMTDWCLMHGMLNEVAHMLPHSSCIVGVVPSWTILAVVETAFKMHNVWDLKTEWLAHGPKALIIAFMNIEASRNAGNDKVSQFASWLNSALSWEVHACFTDFWGPCTYCRLSEGSQKSDVKSWSLSLTCCISGSGLKLM